MEVSREWVEEIEANLPALPDALKQRFVDELGLSSYDAGVLTAERAVAQYFQQTVESGADAKSAANWLTTDLFRLMNTNEIEREDIKSIPVGSEHLAGLLELVQRGTINQSTARKNILPEMWTSGKDAATIVDEKGLAQISDPAIIETIVDKVLFENDNMVQRFLGGNDKVLNALFGKIMGEMRGKGDPAIVRRVLLQRLEALKH